MSEEEKDSLIRALQTIHDMCEKQHSCDSCPLGNIDHRCAILEADPMCWRINDKTSVWRAVY